MLYVAPIKGTSSKIRAFCLVQLKSVQINLLCLVDLLFRTLAVNSVSDFFFYCTVSCDVTGRTSISQQTKLGKTFNWRFIREHYPTTMLRHAVSGTAWIIVATCTQRQERTKNSWERKPGGGLTYGLRRLDRPSWAFTLLASTPCIRLQEALRYSTQTSNHTALMWFFNISTRSQTRRRWKQ